MYDFIDTIEPFIVGLALLYWEVLCGFCFWQSCKSDGCLSTDSVSARDDDRVGRAMDAEPASRYQQATYAPTSSA